MMKVLMLSKLTNSRMALNVMVHIERGTLQLWLSQILLKHSENKILLNSFSFKKSEYVEAVLKLKERKKERKKNTHTHTHT